MMNSDKTQQRQKVYKYLRNGKQQIVKREWVNKGENQYKKEIMEAYFESKIFNFMKHIVKFYYDEYMELNKSVCPVSFSMFYKYFNNVFLIKFKERPNLRINAKIKEHLN